MVDALRQPADRAEEPSISIVLPLHNEEAMIGEILTQLEAVGRYDEIIAVDDGSTDNTAAEVARHPAVRLLQHSYNIGNGGAIKTGLRHASGDIIVVMDGDGQHPVSEIPNLLQHIDRYDMVVGARTQESETNIGRDIANWFFNLYASYVVGAQVADLTSGFRAFRRDAVKPFIPILPNGFSSPTTLTIAFFRSGYTVKYQPFRAPARVGRSKIRPIRDGLRFLLTITRLAVMFVPLKVFMPISLAMMAVGGSYTVGKLAIRGAFSGFGSLIFTVGFLMLMLGLISEQIAMLRALRE